MSKVRFDSRENHQKLLAYGSTTITINSFVFGQTDTIYTHSAGYKPNARVYYDPDNNGDIWPVTEFFWGSTKNDIRSSTWNTTSTLSIRSDNLEASNLTVPVYYRIYEEGDTTVPESFTSFKEVERIQKVITGSFTASSGGGITTETVAHGLGEKCFAVMRWNDGGEWADQGLPIYDAGFTANTAALAHCDSTNVYIEAYNGYGSNRTIQYEVVLYKLEDDDVLFDSRDGTFVNFEEGTTSISITGVVSAGSTKTFSATISHSGGDSFGNLFLTQSRDSTKEWQMPIAPLEQTLGTDGADLLGIITTEHKTTELVIKVRVNNPFGGDLTLDNETWTFRYALFKA